MNFIVMYNIWIKNYFTSNDLHWFKRNKNLKHKKLSVSENPLPALKIHWSLGQFKRHIPNGNFVQMYFLHKQQTNQDFIVCHFHGKYSVTVIKFLQHCFFLQLLHYKLLENDILMIDKKKKQLTKTTFYTTSWPLF